MSDKIHVRLSTDPDFRWEAIARHLAGDRVGDGAGDGASAEAAAVAAWLAAHPEDARLVALVKRRTDRLLDRADVSVDTEAALEKVRARLAGDAGGNAEAPRLTVERGAPAVRRGSVRRPWRLVGLAAAALAAAAGLGQWGRTPTARTVREYRTAVGQRDSIRLPDGTTVLLAPGSHLTVSAAYGTGAREVTLDGAAFFEVRHDAAHPFTVHAAGADIRDLGTAFTVKTATDGGVSVAVTHGVVSLGSAHGSSATPEELRAGDRGTLTRGTVEVRRGVVTPDDVSWTRGTLVYRDAPFAEVQADLLRWYGVELRVTDIALATHPLTASFRGEPVSQIVRTIALALGAEVMQRGDTILLQPMGPDARLP